MTAADWPPAAAGSNSPGSAGPGAEASAGTSGDVPAPAFDPAYPIAAVRPASYNPRHLSDEAFHRLRASLSRFGVVKPIIVNASGVIVAGHQRTKALASLGATAVPAVVLGVRVHTHDEIKMNLIHNAVEENAAHVTLPPADGRAGYHWVDWSKAVVGNVGDGAIRVAACRNLLVRYGPWGSVVAHPLTGRVILNSDYAVACARLRLPLLVYYPTPADADPLTQALAGEYGVYDATQVVATPWAQNVVQPNRLRDSETGNRGGTYFSAAWEFFARPRLTKITRTVDFGAGKADYAQRLRRMGYPVDFYEPFFMTTGKHGAAIDIRAVVRQLRTIARSVSLHSLYDLVVLDSVLNACSDDTYHEHVLRTVAALCADTGVVVISTRSLPYMRKTATARKVKAQETKRLAFLTPDAREINFRSGVFYTMKYHDTATLHEALTPLFAEVQVEDRGEANLYAVCARPRPQPADALRAALEVELNMPYPDGYRHDQHAPTVGAILAANDAAGRLA